MSNIVKVEKDKVKEIKPPKSKFEIKILKDVEFTKLASECRICQRLKFNKGNCGGREGQNICLAFMESPIASKREKIFMNN
jgi:hypothetical protein